MLRTLLGRKKYVEMSNEHPQAVKYFHKRSILDVWRGSKYAYDLPKHTDTKKKNAKNKHYQCHLQSNHFDLPEIMKKPLDILGFQGDQKGTLGRKGLKEVSKTIHWKIIWERIKDNKRTSFKTKQYDKSNPCLC